MAGLLDFVNRAGGKLYNVLDRLATPDVAADPAMLEMMTPEQRDQAKRLARSAGIAGMQRAADAGAHWSALGAEQNIAAQPAYQSYVNNAVQSVEALRKRREDEGRRKNVGDLVARIMNPEDPLSQQYTPEQIAVLQTMDPDAQSALLAKQAFPREAGISVASAGSIQKVVKLANGNIGVVVQTGDPSNPVTVKDTGEQFVSELPSDIRSLLNLREDPSLIQTAGDLARVKEEGTGTGKANVDAKIALPALYQTTANHVNSMKELRQDLAELPSGALTGRVLAAFSSQFQAAQASLYQEALMNIGALKEQGVSLTPISVDELMILLSTSPKLTNNPAANLKILDTRIKRAEEIMAQVQEKLQLLDSGGNITDHRPGATARPQPGQPAPAPRQPSSIPTIKRP